jgi:hypothetical protein
MKATPDIQAEHRLLREVSALVDSGVLPSTLKQTLGKINAENLDGPTKSWRAAIRSGR